MARHAAANFLFLGFAVLGGLWFPIDSLPDWLRALAWITPSWHLGELALMATGLPRANDALLHAGVLVAMTAGAAVFAASGWRRSAV